MKYELTKDLETGNAAIDSEHRELLNAVNRLLDACAQGKGRTALEPTLKFLLDYVNKHFAHEEQLQTRSKYPGYTEHKAFHEGYKKKLSEIAAAIPAAGPGIGDVAALNKHVGVLVTHIKTDDRKLGAFLKNE